MKKLFITLALLSYSYVSVASQKTLFQPKGLIQPKNIISSDINKDGKQDLIISGRNTSKQAVIMIFLQKEDGTWCEQPDTVIQTSGINSFAAADVDGDNAKDLIVVPGCNFLHIYLNTEGFAKKYASKYVNQWHGHVSVGKMSKNGIADVLVGPAWSQFTPGMKIKFGYFLGPRKNDNALEHIADLNLDNDNDVIFAAPGFLRIYYGPFPSRSMMSTTPTKLIGYNEIKLPQSIKHLQSGDMNNDNRPDIIASRYSGLSTNRNTFIYLQNMPIGFNKNQKPSCVINNACGPIVIADLNSDGKNEICIGDRKRDLLIYTLQFKNGIYSANLLDDSNKDTATLMDIALSDLNSDGINDVIMLKYSAKTQKCSVNLLEFNK